MAQQGTVFDYQKKMIELGTVWERRMNAPGYLPHLARIDKKMTKILFARDHGGNIRDVHILTFVELAKYYTRDLALPVEELPKEEYIVEARKLLARQSSKAYHGFIGTKPGMPPKKGIGAARIEKLGMTRVFACICGFVSAKPRKSRRFGSSNFNIG